MKNWESDAIEKLKEFYKENDETSDDLIKNKDALDRFCESFNMRFASSVTFTSEDIADQLLKLRKSGNLPRIRK